jgi:hypothetical protein
LLYYDKMAAKMAAKVLGATYKPRAHARIPYRYAVFDDPRYHSNQNVPLS